jgi:hypothetical protein
MLLANLACGVFLASEPAGDVTAVAFDHLGRSGFIVQAPAGDSQLLPPVHVIDHIGGMNLLPELLAGWTQFRRILRYCHFSTSLYEFNGGNEQHRVPQTWVCEANLDLPITQAMSCEHGPSYLSAVDARGV